MSTTCACGTGKNTLECCARFIDSHERPTTAEELMRARYTAHTLGNLDFILKTHHPVTRSEIDAETTAKWAAESEWLGLEIREVEGGQPDDNEASVEFVARYRDSQGRRQDHYEIALFERKDGEWFFKDAKMPEVKQFKRTSPKQGRNDPCSCGSGKKFKKCCGV